MVRLFATVLAAVFITAASAADEQPTHTLAVNAQVTLAGYPDNSLIEHIRENQGLVIDLRTTDEYANAPSLASAGLEVVSLPIGEGPLTETVAAFQSVVEAAGERKVWVHCASGNRAGLLWAAYQIEQGVDTEAAIDAVRPIATKKRTRQAIRNYASQSAQPQ